MRKQITATVICLALGFSLIAHADGPMDFGSGKAVRDARGLRNAGIAVTVIGALAVTTAAIVGGASYESHLDRDGIAIFEMTGIGLGAAGAATLATGIPMLAIGTVREKKARAKIAFAPAGAVGTF